ncbi:tetratricopeptide repeat-containing hybrid sensor histidine kinase/response regulator [Cellulophaga fucicola]|uniref:histidine kinase n=1 Tax=Cellulophaga fucicola TaxID=76595 RepID=A0A1K1N257_9FLAO|nr:ATP-binding protein [Cellulophaga fucicola]SFW29393.1 Signal transduction histidine kinase [Cellulophaga fucicola]
MKSKRTKVAHKNLLVTILSFLLFTYAHSQDSPVALKDLDYHFSVARKYQNQDNIEKALQAIQKATEYAEKNEDEKGLIDCFHHYAFLYLKLNNVDRSKFYWERTKVLLKDIAYPYGSSENKYLEAIYLYLDKNNFQAEEKLSEAKRLSNDRNLLNRIALTQANINFQKTNFLKASRYYNALIVNSDIYEKDYFSTQGYLGLAKINSLDNPEDCIKYCLEALPLARKNEFIKELLEANSLLSTAYEDIGDYNSSLRANKDLIKIKDSLYAAINVKAKERTANDIHIEGLEEDVKNLVKKNLEQEQSITRSESTNIVAFAILVIISLLAVSLYRNNQIKIKTNNLLQKTNTELEIAKDKAVKAMEAKTNFLSTVSHELRTPLYAVTGLTNLLLEENPTQSQKDHLKSLKFSGDYLLNFINDILQVNKIDAQKLETLQIEFNLRKTIRDVIDSLQQSAKSNNTSLTLAYDKNMSRTHLGDPIKISQILINLIGNAIKFTKNGSVVVTVKELKRIEDICTIYFEVKDTGIGISEELQENIFDSFEQGSIQINREYGGTGLGLTIVKNLLGLFGSDINLESKKGVGSAFSFEIKLVCKDQNTDNPDDDFSPREFIFEGLHLLIVEDNKINQVITKKMLSKKGMTSDIANNGTEGVELTRINNYDAILMDIHMPGISGVEATIEIRKFNTEIPIIALTAISLDDSVENFYAAGCDDIVTKPFKPEYFYQKIGENIFNKKTT